MIKSRRQILLAALFILFLLDAGRSLYARLAYARPTAEWQNAPYEPMKWPPSANVPPDAGTGERVYIENCAVCHGLSGQGNGPAAPSLIPRPRDFTKGTFKYKSTAGDEPPTEADLYRMIAEGMPGSAMTPWGDILAEAEITAVIAAIKSFAIAEETAVSHPLAIPPRTPSDGASIARGESFVVSEGCYGCHSSGLRGGSAMSDKKSYPVYTRDLTALWTFRGGSDPDQIWLRLSSDMSPGPMESHQDTLTPAERWDVVNFLLDNARAPPWENGGVLAGPGNLPDAYQRGRYLTQAGLCGYCHTQISADLRYSGDDFYLGGGAAIQVYPQAVFVTPNLGVDERVGLGSWTMEQIAEVLQDGRPSSTNLWAATWQPWHDFNETDAAAIGSYLKSLPPIPNRVAASLRYGVVETIMTRLAGVQPDVFIFKDGNYGQAGGSFLAGLFPGGWAQSFLIAGQWLTLALGMAAFVWAGRRPQLADSRLWDVLAGVGLLLVMGGGWYVLNMPLEPVGFVGETAVFTPDAAVLDTPERAALAERGQYLYQAMGCAACHGGDGGGGLKMSAASFGAIWSSNISSDPELGIGGWQDMEIARAIRAGVGQDGRSLHWRAMPWDHYSNLEEEDVRAIILYLRLLPPVKQRVPTPLPPAEDDCPAQALFLTLTEAPGCSGG